MPSFIGSYTRNSYVGQKALIAGWGCSTDRIFVVVKFSKYINYFRFLEPTQLCPYSAILKSVEQNIVECPADITDRIICVSTLGPKSPGIGDAGAPLVLPFDAKDGPIQIGIFSMAAANQYDIVRFTRVSSYLKWIKEITGIAHY